MGLGKTGPFSYLWGMVERIVKFRPLRRIKKTGKIVVASYMNWNKVRTSDYYRFDLIIDNEYRGLPRNERVVNHKGEDLFFFKYKPEDILTYSWLNVPEGPNYGTPYRIDYESGNYMYMGIGLDVAGTPTLSHWTTDYLANTNCINLGEVEPLTVGTVIDWYAWFLFNLDKANISLK